VTVAPALDVSVSLAERGLEIALSVSPGETVALLGPNGSGKSTLLAIVAGLLRPDSGHVTLGGEPLVELGRGAPARFVAPHVRGVALLAQDALLFPHLSVLENVAFGPRSSGISRAESRLRAVDWLEQVEASDLGRRRPAELSGGQAQRVAVARALAAGPRALLLDEPFGSLDASVVPKIRALLSRVLEERSVLLVTHDPLDALALADRVIVLDAGRIVEEGPTREVLLNPQTSFTQMLTFGLREPL
jgi:ABC-type sulfate/molybdate transport systems ATPase subunit